MRIAPSVETRVRWFERKDRDAIVARRARRERMTEAATRIDDEQAWAMFAARDRCGDGRFVVAVTTTGIYCRPSCPARRPKRQNVRFFADGAEAVGAGFRPCLRCKPDEAARDGEAIAAALRLIGEAEEPPTLEALAGAVGYSPFHFHRIFRRATGVTPAAYARAMRLRRMEASLAGVGSVTDAIYDAGYSGPSRFYADAGTRLGMSVSAWRDGGAGETIRWAVVPTSLGAMLVAATPKGICRLAFDEGEEALRLRFPNARIEPADEAMEELAGRAIAAVDAPQRPHDLPLDVRGTAFQEAVWQALTRIPPGESMSYSVLAERAGKPGAARAAGTACGANPVAILVPCHRARRGDGSPGGYAWGLERKAELLKREGAVSAEQLLLLPK
jgi:AraC family transcriptional regulator of adaptative response/methylated-DNA-[protein]-cysteine methyltransferase